MPLFDRGVASHVQVQMLDFSSHAEGINPCGIYGFVDKAQVWLKQPLSHARLKLLKRQCGPGGLHKKSEKAWFDCTLMQRLQLNQPSLEALQSLCSIDGLLLNYVEISLDWVFDHEGARNGAYDFMCQYHVKKYHRGQGIRWEGGGVTRYTGPRKAPNVLAVYRDRPSKVTGEVNCVHFDWRIKGAVALRRAGITSLTDLVELNHRQFWNGRLLLRALSLRDLGRMYHVHVAGKGRRRGAWVVFSGRKGFPYHADLRAGAAILRALNSTQAVLDCYIGKFNVNRCLRNVSGEHLLPRDISL
jgi:hypothetical protein